MSTPRIVYVGISCKNNGEPDVKSAYSVHYPNGELSDSVCQLHGTNIRAELSGILHAARESFIGHMGATSGVPTEIRTNCQYCIRILHGRDRCKAHQDMWRQLLPLMRPKAACASHPTGITVKYVSGDSGNDRALMLAREHNIQ